MSRCCARSPAGGTAAPRGDPARHDTSRFACGNPTLDDHRRDTAARDAADRTAVAYVLVDADPTPLRRILGYFTLNSFAFPKKRARRRDQDKTLGGYNPVPAVLIGRLALDAACQGQGLGSVLLVAALARVLSVSEQVGVAVVVVHGIDDAATGFYARQGFTPFRDEPNHLYLPLATFAAGLAMGDPSAAG